MSTPRTAAHPGTNWAMPSVRWTVRLRLTLLYGLLFLVSGAALLTITYVLVNHATSPGAVFVKTGHGQRIVSASGTLAGRAPIPAGGLPGSGETGSKQSVTIQVSGGGGGNGINVPVHGLSPRQMQQQAQNFAKLAAQEHTTAMHQLFEKSGVALALMALLSIMLGWLVAGRTLRPLRKITATAREISVTNLHRRLELAGPDDELKELGDTFDQLLERLDRSFDAQRRFVANASHELRTPLARQRALIQVALADPDATIESLRRTHQRVLASGEQQEHLIDALLTLSRGQAGLTRRDRVDVATIARETLFGRRSEMAGRHLSVQSTLPRCLVEGDARLVERLMSNLLDNAIKHNVDGGWIAVDCRDEGGCALVVRNGGPAIPPDALDGLIQPFHRLGRDRVSSGDGQGLGLSIVQAIAEAHGATMELRAPGSGGLEVRVRFPVPSSGPTAGKSVASEASDGTMETHQAAVVAR